MTTTEQVQEVLSSINQRRGEQQLLWASNAERFNIFDALDIEYRELSHSKFLAFLLDPDQSHDQGCRYLQSFLKLIDIEIAESLENIQVVTERPIPHCGQLDILIHLPSVLTVCIENKVGAGDQENQIGRYLNWLKKDAKTKGKRIAVYLSPDGRAPRQPPLGSDLPPLKLLSYQAVADWLQRQPSPERLSNVTKMYIETCRKISGVAMKKPYDEQIGAVLKTPEQFAAALEIADFVAAEKPLIIKQFWQNTCDCLNKKLSDGGLSSHWKAHLSMEKQGWLAIAATELGIDCAYGSMGHAVTVESVISAGGCFGVRRGSKKRIDVQNPLDDLLVHQLIGSHFGRMIGGVVIAGFRLVVFCQGHVMSMGTSAC